MPYFSLLFKGNLIWKRKTLFPFQNNLSIRFLLVLYRVYHRVLPKGKGLFDSSSVELFIYSKANSGFCPSSFSSYTGKVFWANMLKKDLQGLGENTGWLILKKRINWCPQWQSRIEGIESKADWLNFIIKMFHNA